MPTTVSAKMVSPTHLEETIGVARSLPQGSPAAILLENFIAAVKRGADVTLFETDKELTPNEAAELLHVSRPHLVKIMDRGLLNYRKVGTNRRIAMPDLLDYIERHERANAHVSQLLGTRAHAPARVMDAAAELTSDDLAALAALDTD